MKRRLLLLIACAAWTTAAHARAADISGAATLTSDYVWRGTTQTQGDPALQAGARLDGASGLYASAWGSNVDFGPATGASTEFDFTVGWTGAMSDAWSVDANVLHYRYPSTSTDLDWTEVNGTLRYADRYWIGLGWSPEALGGDVDGLYAQIGARLPIRERLHLEALAAHYAIDDAYGDYAHAQLGVAWTVNPSTSVRITAHTTDVDAKRRFGEDAAGTRVEAALQFTF